MREWPALIAIGIWASLATVTGDALATLRPSVLLAVALAAASATFALLEWRRGTPVRRIVAPGRRDVLLGVYGLGVYHALLFTAFDLAPIVEANLVNDTWPLLTVMLGVFVAGEPGGWRTWLGAALGAVGTVFVVAGDRGLGGGGAVVGYACALGAAVIWAHFTATLKVKPIDPAALAWSTAIGAGLSAVWAFAEGVPAPDLRGVTGAVYLGALPIAAATMLWEAGIRRGRVTVVGLLSFLIPPLSTALLVVFLGRPLTWSAAAGGALILGGAALGTWKSASPEPAVAA